MRTQGTPPKDRANIEQTINLAFYDIEKLAIAGKPITLEHVLDTEVKLKKSTQALIDQTATNRCITELEAVLAGLPPNSNNEYTVVILDRTATLRASLKEKP